MEKAVLAGILALAASASFAQTAADPAGARGPANLCQELLAFMEAPPPAATAAPAAPAQVAKAEPAKDGVAPASAGAKAADTAAAGSAAKEGASSPQATGQSGPATDAPDPNVAGAKNVGKAEDAPQKASVSAPVPTDGKSVSKESVLSVAEAGSLAAANDIAACQTAARELRIAGVAVPSPLLALTALDLKYQSTTRP